jgi:alpha-tubulin suppressor-like RCC1 family protein
LVAANGAALWCWGGNNSGQLGDGTTTSQYSPEQIGTSTWKAVAAGAWHTCGLQTDGSLWCWGNNDSGQLGDGTLTYDYGQKNAPDQIGTSTQWVAIAAGFLHTCGLQVDGSLWCWGWNEYGSLGDGTTNTQPAPEQVGVGASWTAIALGDAHTCGIQTNGSLWCWGNNRYGQLGDGNPLQQQNAPERIGTSSLWASVTAHGVNTCGLQTDDSLFCWGWNYSGQIGDGTTSGQSNQSKPEQIMYPSP